MKKKEQIELLADLHVKVATNLDYIVDKLRANVDAEVVTKLLINTLLMQASVMKGFSSEDFESAGSNLKSIKGIKSDISSKKEKVEAVEKELAELLREILDSVEGDK